MALSPSSGKKFLGPGCATVFLIPFLAVGLGVMGFGLYQLARGHATQSWPVVEGVVTASGTRTTRGSKGSSSLHADIHYAYAWQGVRRQGTDIRVGGDVAVNGRGLAMDEDLANYPVGKAVRVRVDPDHPDKAVLEPGVAWVPVLFFLVFGAVFGGFAALVLFLVIRQARKQKEAAPAGDVIAFDAEQADGAPAAVAWTPLPGIMASNTQTSRLTERRDGTWQVAPTRVMWTMAWGAALAGLIMWGVAMWLAFSELGKTVPIGAKAGLWILGGLSVLPLVWMLRQGKHRPSFAPGERMCRNVREAGGFFGKGRSDVPFSQVIGLQILSRFHESSQRDRDSPSYTSYQLNLVLKDFTRRSVMGHGNQAALEKDAESLAKMLQVPLWTRVL